MSVLFVPSLKVILIFITSKWLASLHNLKLMDAIKELDLGRLVDSSGGGGGFI